MHKKYFCTIVLKILSNSNEIGMKNIIYNVPFYYTYATTATSLVDVILWKFTLLKIPKETAWHFKKRKLQKRPNYMNPLTRYLRSSCISHFERLFLPFFVDFCMGEHCKSMRVNF